MERSNRILATYVTYKMLYNDKGTDVYDIISEFIRYIIIKEQKKSFLQSELSTLVIKYFDFQIPSLVLKPAIKRIHGVTLQDKRYYFDFSKIENHANFYDLQETAINNNNIILNDLISYIKNKCDIEITENVALQISESFRRYILDESTNDMFVEYISAFIIEKSVDEDYINNLNQIREGHILYDGLSFNHQIASHGWNSKLTIYLDMEILFHIAGFNGTTFKRIGNEFLNLISDANKDKNLISLKYFTETKKEIEKFFSTAETIYSTNAIIHPGETAMEYILSDCKSTIDITNKKNSFFFLLNKNKIFEETKSDFYSPKYDYANLESLEYTASNEQADVQLISHINKLRRNETFHDYSDAKAILISETGSVLEFSKLFTREKEDILSKSSGKEQKIIPYAVNLYTITNMLWYRLNNSLHRKTEPATIDAVVRAQIVLSKYINESITRQYEDLIISQKSSNLDKEELAALIIGMRRRSSKPENIIIEGVDDALNFICENDIDKFREDYELEISAHKKLEKDYQKTLQQLTQTQSDITFLQSQYQYNELKHDYENAKAALTNLNEWLNDSQTNFNNQIAILNTSKKHKCIIITILYILYYFIIGGCIITIGWNVMEPITYILGIPPILYLFISKYHNLNWSIDKWIKSYEKNSKYVDAQNRLNNYIKKVKQQEKLVDEKYAKLKSYQLKKPKLERSCKPPI